MAVMGDNVFEQYATNDQDRQISRALSQMFDAAQSNQDYNEVNQFANRMYAQEQLPPMLAQEALRRIKETPGAMNQAIPYGKAYGEYQEQAGGYLNDPTYQVYSHPQASALQNAILDTVRIPTGGGSYLSGRGDVRQQQLAERSQARQAAVADRGTQAAMGMPGFGYGSIDGRQVLVPEAGAKNAALRSESLARASVDPVTGRGRALPGDGSGGLMRDAVTQMFGQDALNIKQDEKRKAQEELDRLGTRYPARGSGRSGGQTGSGKAPSPPMMKEYQKHVDEIRAAQQGYDTLKESVPYIQQMAEKYQHDPDFKLTIGTRSMTPEQWLYEANRAKRPEVSSYEDYVQGYSELGHPEAKAHTTGQREKKTRDLWEARFETSALSVLSPQDRQAVMGDPLFRTQLEREGFFQAPPDIQMAYLKRIGLAK